MLDTGNAPPAEGTSSRRWRRAACRITVLGDIGERYLWFRYVATHTMNITTWYMFSLLQNRATRYVVTQVIE